LESWEERRADVYCMSMRARSMPEGEESRRERWVRAALGWWEVKRLWSRELGKRGSGLDGEDDIVVVVCDACCEFTGGMY